MTTGSFVLSADHPLRRLRSRALVAGAVAIVLCLLGGYLNPTQLVRSYLVGYAFWLGIALGSMAILMIHHVAGGAWGAVIRRPLESATRTIPLLAVLFLPIALGTGALYEWAHPEVVAHDPILSAKAIYLNVPFFLVRAVLYFAIWIGLAAVLNRFSLQQDREAGPASVRRLQFLSQGGLLLYGLTVSFAAIDWLMSLEPHWFSTIYGLLIMGGQGVAAFAFVIAIAAVLATDGPLEHVIGRDQFRDLGSFLLAFLMIWAYLALSQLLIIWSANLPEEISWYLRRSTGGWLVVGYGLVIFHFALPFLVLLSRDVKRRARWLALLALWILVLRFVDMFWLIVPSWEKSGLSVHWLDVVAPIAVGGIWLWSYVGHLARHPLVAIGDPTLPPIEGAEA